MKHTDTIDGMAAETVHQAYLDGDITRMEWLEMLDGLRCCTRCGGTGVIDVDTPWSGSEPTADCPECQS